MFRPKQILIIGLLFFASFYFTIPTWAQLTRAQIDSLQKELPKAKNDTSKVTLLITLGNNVGYYDAKKVVEYGQEAMDISTRFHYTFGIGRSAYLLASTYMDQGNFKLSDSFLTVAEKCYTAVNNKNYLTMVYDSRGSWNFMQGNYWEAADFYTKSAKGFDELKDTADALISYQNLIAVLAETKQFEQAVAEGRKILPIVEKRKDTLAMGYTLQGLTTDLMEINHLDEASQYIPLLKTIIENSIDNNLASDAYGTIATYYYDKKDYATSVEYFKKALAKAATIDNRFQVAIYNKSIGSAYLEMNNFEMAKQHLLKALEMSKQYKLKRGLYNVTAALGEYYNRTGDNKKAYEYLKQHLELKDSILGAETRKYASHIETMYQTNKKEEEILRLNKVQEEKDAAIKKRNMYILIGGGLFVAVVIIFVLLYRNYRNKQKLASQQAALQDEKILTMEKEQQVMSLQSMVNGQETERTRIARDLHDGLGGIFSTVKMHFSTLQHEVPELRSNTLYKKSFDLVNNASEELRKVAQNMMPEVLLKIGLTEALQDFCSNINSSGVLHISLQAYGMDKRLSASTEIMLYRIIQELINNIIKHASATEAIIQFNREGNRLSITVEDNGRGFDTKEVTEKRSMGIETVQSRVDYLNGKMTIDSRKNIGTTVMIDLLIND